MLISEKKCQSKILDRSPKSIYPQWYPNLQPLGGDCLKPYEPFFLIKMQWYVLSKMLHTKVSGSVDILKKNLGWYLNY